MNVYSCGLSGGGLGEGVESHSGGGGYGHNGNAFVLMCRFSMGSLRGLQLMILVIKPNKSCP